MRDQIQLRDQVDVRDCFHVLEIDLDLDPDHQPCATERPTRPMNWDAIGAIGEIVGAAAVVLTLVYLAVQIRQSSRVASLQASQHVLEGAAEWQLRIAADERLERIFAAGCRSYDSLEGGDRQRFYALIGEFLMRYEVQTQMHEAGMLNDDNFAAATRGVVRLMGQPGARAVCERAIADGVPSERFEKIMTKLLEPTPRA